MSNLANVSKNVLVIIDITTLDLTLIQEVGQNKQTSETFSIYFGHLLARHRWLIEELEDTK